MVAPAPTRPYDVAISSTEYDVTLERVLADRLRRRLPAADAVWTRDGQAALGVPALVDVPMVEEARMVVVLHDRMWGQTDATRGDRSDILGRIERDGPDFLRVLLLDDAPPPPWMVEVSRVSETDLDAYVENLVDAVQGRGGLTRADPAVDVAARAAGDEQHSRESATFLASHRANSALTRELERLVDEVARRAGALEAELPGVKVGVARSPGRCVVQFGPVALTLSWVRVRGDSVTDGRLMIIEWVGTVRRGTERIPERAVHATAPRPATVRREDVLVADATKEAGWLWRREGAAFGRHTSAELAAMHVDSLLAAARELTPVV